MSELDAIRERARTYDGYRARYDRAELLRLVDRLEAENAKLRAGRSTYPA